MCGIAGFFNRKHHDKELLRSMIGQIRHRGPDGFGTYIDDKVGLAHARLSIIDLTPDGFQPIHNEDKSVWVTFNGEIFNYIELKEELLQKGHKFYTNTDTEVIVHLYEEHGMNFVQRLTGQFAIALYDKSLQKAMLIRDRMGIRPLYYHYDGYTMMFASEVKSIFADSTIPREINNVGLLEMFTYWSHVQPGTSFTGIHQLPEGHYMVLDLPTGKTHMKRYWDHEYNIDCMYEDTAKQRFLEEFRKAVKLRLRADVPVGAYLSGGLDSTAIVRTIMDTSDNPLRTFSIAFDDKQFDETSYQQQVVDMYGIDHTTFQCSYQDVADNFAETIYHTESPILRTAPVPMFILAKMVKESGYSVVLTGEGADEALGGYDLFRETLLRREMVKNPDSPFIPDMLKALYPWRKDITKNAKYSKMFFGMSDDIYSPYFSHGPRWSTTSRAKRFMKSNPKMDMNEYYNSCGMFQPPDFIDMNGLAQAQYMEYHTLLSGYLLSSQGDRVSAGNAVEGRYPFLDHNLVELCDNMPMHLKLNFMNEKYILKEVMKGKIPDSIFNRKKQPYMAPDGKAFFGTENNVLDYLSKERVDTAGYFDYNKLKLLINKFSKGHAGSFPDNMALVGILSTHVLHDTFVENFEAKDAPSQEEVFVDIEL